MSLLRKIYNVLNAVIRRGYWFNNIKFKDCRKLWTYDQFNTEVVNLGSTSGLHAFDYTDINAKCANWAISNNPLLGDFAILKNYVSYLKEGATVIIPLCPFSSLAGRYKISEDRYYSILYPSSIPDFSFRRAQQIKNEMLAPVLSYSFYGFFLDLKNLIWHNNKILSEDKMRLDSKKWIKDWKREFNISDFSNDLSLVNRDSILDAIGIINGMISFCKERNLTPAILIPPVYHTLSTEFNDDFQKRILSPLLDGIEDKFIWYHNYMDDQEFINDCTLFDDSFLLNKKGAKLFTNRVLKDLSIL